MRRVLHRASLSTTKRTSSPQVPHTTVAVLWPVVGRAMRMGYKIVGARHSRPPTPLYEP
jgi:hypothetical protein